jgi:hypothetical protein
VVNGGRGGRRDRDDGGGRLFGLGNRIVPERRRPWVRALRAELSAIDDLQARKRFALGAAWAIVRMRLTPGPIMAAVLLTAGTTTVAVAAWNAREPSLRVGLLALVVLLVALVGLGRRPQLFGPSSPGAAANAVNAIGLVLVGAMVLTIVSDMSGSVPAASEKLTGGLPIYAIVLGGYVVGFLAVTAASGGASSGALANGLTAGFAAPVGWLVMVALVPPVPATALPAVALILLACVPAAHAGRRRGQDAHDITMSALLTAAIGSLLVVVLVWVTSRFGDAALVPHLAPPTANSAKAVAQSRIEVNDHYLYLLLLGSLASIGLTLTRHDRTVGLERQEAVHPVPPA